MKRFLLVVAFLLFSNVARAEYIAPQNMTVREYYSLVESDNRSEKEWWGYFEMVGYLQGIRDFNADKYSLQGNQEAVECIGRPLNVWQSLVFDNYKLNKVKGDALFRLHFIGAIEGVCNVDLWGIKKVEVEKTMPTPPLAFKILEITDGDTIKITKGDEVIKVRLADIDCFETSANPRGKWQAEYYNKSIDEVVSLGNQSKEILQDFVEQQAGGKVVLVDRGKDKYKRTLGVLYIDGVNVNEYMLQYGKCEKYMPKPLPSLM